jgi:phosphoribosylaminoimidazole (AIR) synthetase
MLRTFNLGVGYVVIVREAAVDAVRRALQDAGETVWAIGEVVAGPAGVEVA